LKQIEAGDQLGYFDVKKTEAESSIVQLYLKKNKGKKKVETSSVAAVPKFYHTVINPSG
jgi:hypothetical protein